MSASTQNKTSATAIAAARTLAMARLRPWWWLVLASLGVLLAASLTLASQASAEQPWWGLEAGARPAYLKEGVAKTEVQELVTSPEVGFTLSAGEKEVGVFFLTEPLFAELKEVCEEPGFVCLQPTAANVQKALEAFKPYGPGTVVSGGQLAEGKPLTVTEPFGRGVPALKVSAFAGEASVSELSQGRPDGQLFVKVENLGDASLAGYKMPVRITDTLPAGVSAVGVAGTEPVPEGNDSFTRRPPLPCAVEASGTRVSCTFTGALAPFSELEMRLAVVVHGPVAGENVVDTSGGEGFLCKSVGSGAFSDNGCKDPGAGGFERSSIGPVAPASLRRPLTISAAPVPFGVEHYELANEEEGGALARHAGAHPFQQTTSVTLNQGADIGLLENQTEKPHVNPVALAKDLHFRWPAGLIGNPNAFPQCDDQQFFAITENGAANECPAASAVGVADVTINEPGFTGTAELPVPLFNLKPHVGEPARFGFNVTEGNAPVVIDTSVRTGSDYGVTVSVHNITQSAAFLSSQVTVWGVPGDPRHDRQRGWSCLLESRGFRFEPASRTIPPCPSSGEASPMPFLSLPTSCTGPLHSYVEGDSWSEPGPLRPLAESTMPALDSCNRLPFSSEVNVAPDGREASKPTGLNIDVHVSQEEDLNGAGLSSAAVRDITVGFPEGVVLNPASADGLQACSEELIGLQPGNGPNGEFSFTPTLPEPLQQSVNFCPDASKIATVTIKSPLLPKGQFVEGALYLATPAPNGEPGKNPFNTLIAAYIVAKDPISGTLVKLPGVVTLDGTTGQITSKFENSPQLAFEDAEIHLLGGERAPLATPSHCGTYTTDAEFAPWSGTPPVKSSSSFQITSGPGGGPCPPAVLPFNPTLSAGSPNINAGGFSPLNTTVTREDGNQDINKVQLHFAPGMSGILAGVPLCKEAEANAGTCPESSLIGKTIVSVGLGGDPFSVTGGKVYLTEKYEGAPFGLSIVNPAVAGPFDLGKVIVRAKIEIDPRTAALTVTTGTIPHILDGIPLQIKHVNVLIDRQGFTFNPTNCNPLSIGGTIGSVEGVSSPVSVPFQVTNCAALKFTPRFSVSTGAHTSKANGASLTAKLSEPNEPFGSQANIARVKVELPKQLPSRLTTLQKACTNAQFEANPAGCPAASNIGHAKVTTPLLPVALEGPAIFVSHGGEAFPSLTMVLQGYGVTVDLVGTTFISKAGVTSTTFKTVPDVPFNTFELTLPTGKFSALTALGSVCSEKLTMPTEFVAQNGMTLNQNTNVAVTGCPKKKALTRAQKLALALKACHKRHDHAKRVSCERLAHRKYGPVSRKQTHKRSQ